MPTDEIITLIRRAMAASAGRSRVFPPDMIRVITRGADGLPGTDGETADNAESGALPAPPVIPANAGIQRAQRKRNEYE